MHDSAFQTSIGRRARNLRTLAPILALELNKRRVTKLDLTAFDLTFLAMIVLDQIITSMGSPEKGAKRSDIYQALADPVRKMDPTADRAVLESVADYLIQELANSEERDVFRDRYFDPDMEGGKWVSFTFKLIEERLIPGLEEYRWIASDEAINLYFQSLDVDLQAAEVAHASIIRYYMAQNRWKEAGDAAERAGKLSIGFRNELLNILDNLARNAADIEYQRDLLPLLTRSRQHLKDRISSEYDLFARAEEAIQVADPNDRPHIRRLRDYVRLAMEQHQELEHHLSGANDRFVEQQTRQRFRPTATLRFHDPIAEILRPLLTTKNLAVEEWFNKNAHFFLPPVRRAMGDLVTIAPLLLQDPRVISEASQVTAPGQIEEFAPVEYFSVEEAAHVDGFVRGLLVPFSLADAISQARSSDLTPKERHLLVLRLLRLYGETGDNNVSADAAAGRLNDPEWYGNNLVFRKDS